MSELIRCDLAIVGGGPGGYVAAIRAAQLGKDVVVVEREHLGGICLNWGCIPTKALLRSAEVYNTMKEAADYGLSARDIAVDYPAVVARSRGIAERLSGGVGLLMRKNGIRVVEGGGRLNEERKVVVTDATGSVTVTIDSEAVILATGARARDFPNMRIDRERIISSREALSLTTLPTTLGILGAGSIGVEFAHHFASFGVEVHLFEAQDRLLPLADADQSRELSKAFRKQGIKAYTGTMVTGVERTSDGLELTYERKGKRATLGVERLLMAVGVQPNSEAIGLEEAGVATERGFVVTNARGETNVPGVYAIGDLAGEPCLAHVASAEGIVAVEALCGHDVAPIDYENIPACTYATPQVASVGLTEAAARERFSDVRVGKFPMVANGKALALGETAGFVKAVLDGESGLLLGLHVVGTEATELLLEGTLARSLAAGGKDLLRSIHPHPTIGEGIHEAVAAALGEAIHL